jgi:hypothetical protein
MGTIAHVEIDTGQRRQFVPLWMIDEVACSQMSISSEPQCSLPSLWRLASLLQDSGL